LRPAARGTTFGPPAAAAVTVLGAALVSGCGSSAPTQATTADGPPPPSLAAKCGDVHGVRARPFWLRASDGQRLYAAAGGSAAVGVVLVPESPPGDVCGWLPYIATLERQGLRFLSLDYRGTGDSPATTRNPFAYGRDLAAAIAGLRGHGARTIFLGGASFGAVAAMQYGPGLDADGIISLSGETRLPELHVDALTAIPRLRVPLLIVGTRRDSYVSVRDALMLLRRAGSSDKRIAFFPGSRHGWEIVENAPYAARARALIRDWIRAHAGTR
jgi:alpha/beta superfamily hydrolase